MVSSNPKTLSVKASYEEPALNASDDPLDWDSWLTPEALLDETDPSQLLLQRTPQPHFEVPEICLPSDQCLQMAQSIDTNKKPRATISSPGVYAFTRHGNKKVSSLVNIKNEQPQYSESNGAFGPEKSFLTSPNVDNLIGQDTERGLSRDPRPVNNWSHADQYIDCIQNICHIATGETLSHNQARRIENCCNCLVTDLLSNDPSVALKFYTVNCHLDALPRVDLYVLDSSLTACVAYLRYLNSVGVSTAKPDDLNRRLAQIWIHIHFENYVNDLKKNEAEGVPINRRGRAVSTIARDSILQAVYGSQFMPQKADRDFLSDQCRWGERWWKVATFLGLGVVLLANDHFVNHIGRRTAFQNKMVDTLVIYFLNRYPDLISFYRSFDPMAIGLMSGANKFCSRDQPSILPEELAEDEVSMLHKQEKWLIPNLKSLPRLAASRLISIMRS
ncbi:uncharacterized protein N7484_008137 [Penicillium longicatenatum]|uniref:uncharacterized protein n=1 Tax=Penicillium longicatenatum TaxID=1561947 RepID=UPI0025480AE5|nr:uncharacterized protein N7484_008137 [Penicillium longicatenatum]KAJ5640275.1 hypothetical protein N7484_008137 [Penicillium longicatenatum]